MKTIALTTSMSHLRDELIYTEARLMAEPLTADLAKGISQLIDNVEKIAAGQETLWRKEEAAQALSDACDDLLDDFVFSLEDHLKYTLRKEHNVRESARFTLYFKKSPREIRRLGLRSQLPEMKTWANTLKGENEQTLKDLATELDTLIQKGDKTITQMDTLAAERNAYRTRTIEPLIEEINSARTKLFATLIQRADANQKPRDYQERFFKKTSRPTPSSRTENKENSL